jgi:class 3 adenylate cyclase
VHPDVVERKLAAILSGDVAGYGRLMASDEVATVRALQAAREHIAAFVRQHRGRVVDSPGDNLLAEFPSALDATRCAIEVPCCPAGQISRGAWGQGSLLQVTSALIGGATGRASGS